MKVYLVVAAEIPLHISKALSSHKTQQALEIMKELSHFPNSHGKGIAETDRESKQESLMMNDTGMTLFHLQNAGLYYSSEFDEAVLLCLSFQAQIQNET